MTISSHGHWHKGKNICSVPLSTPHNQCVPLAVPRLKKVPLATKAVKKIFKKTARLFTTKQIETTSNNSLPRLIQRPSASRVRKATATQWLSRPLKVVKRPTSSNYLTAN